jgi:hypothetical protein
MAAMSDSDVEGGPRREMMEMSPLKGGRRSGGQRDVVQQRDSNRQWTKEELEHAWRPIFSRVRRTRYIFLASPFFCKHVFMSIS